MITSALNTAASSIKAQQQAIDVISHNIANVNTRGYSRQSAMLATASPDSQGAFHFGRGVQLTGIQRAVDPFLNKSLNTNSNQLAFSQTLEQGLNGVESVFGSLDTPGLSSSIDSFFQAYQLLANNPQDAAQRNNVRARGLDISTNLTNMRSQMVSAQSSADQGINGRITQSNLLLDRIASLNKQISAQENTTNNAANDLRDQRDVAVRDLATLIPVQIVNGNSNALLVQTQGGDLLVQDGDTRYLARGGSAGAGFTGITIAANGAKVSGIESGGEIGALITLRDTRLGDYISQLDSLASNLIFGLNQLHSSGAGLTLPKIASAEQAAASTGSAVDSATQNIPFAGQIVSGSFKVHAYDAAGAPVSAGGTSITITKGTTTVVQVVSQLNATAGINASIDASGYIVVNAGSGNVGFSNDTSNFLAAYEIGAFFHGNNASNVGLSATVKADANLIAAGAINTTTSLNNPGNNSTALNIISFQNSVLSVDGSTAASVLDRTATLAMNYGNDVQNANQNRIFREAESQSLNAQRQNISGVSTDEELINMIKFQRAYEASAKVIQTSNRMLDSLLGLIR
ncbi:MAG: flagellar hook-associated protein FlgK [Mariprofundaceae bacterium]